MQPQLNDPAITFIREKMKRLQAQADKAQAEAQDFERGWAAKQRRAILQPHPAATHFLLQHQIGALDELVAELERGEHLAK